MTLQAPLAVTPPPRGLALRPLAIPVEHGGWGLLAEPAALALLVAPSPAGGAVALAGLFAFLARHPLLLALRDLHARNTRPRTAVCAWLAAGYATAALVALTFAVSLSGARLVVPLLVASPLALFQLVYDTRRAGRALAPELTGAAAIGSLAASIALAGSQAPALAATLWLLAAMRSIPSIVFVRVTLGRGSRGGMIALHVIAVAAAALLWWWGGVPVSAVAAMLLLLGRAVAPPPSSLHARAVGMRELLYGAVITIAVGMSF